MSINLVTKFLPYVDEQFKAESKRNLVTNQDFDWTGAKTVKVYKISTSSMNDYDRDGTGANASRYGAVAALDAITEEMTLSKDRSFTFAIDKLDEDETAMQLNAAAALARQNREVVIPEVDNYVYGKMVSGAGTAGDQTTLTADNIYSKIIAGTNVLDSYEIPETGRVLIVTPDTYMLMKQNQFIVMATEIGSEDRKQGVIGYLDGMAIQKVPASRLPSNFGFMIAHPSATVAPVKLQDYKIHVDPPGISGSLVEGRIAYDAFVLDNKKRGIFYQSNYTLGVLTVASAAGTNAGDTALTVTPSKGASNVYKYKVGTSETAVLYGDDLTDWTTWDGSSDITAETGKILTLVECTSAYKARKIGSVTVTAKAES